MKLKTNIILSLVLAICVSFVIIKKFKPIPDKHTIPIIFNKDSVLLDKDNLKNKVVLISYFQTWCGDCVKEQPELQKLQNLFGTDSLSVLMISDEPLYKINAFQNRFSSQLNFYKTNSGLKKDLGVNAFPTTYLIDKDGKVLIRKVEGINWYTPEVIQTIRKALQ